ncbi:PEP-CTERM sorting domain-containing protein [Thermodesulfobacteriota bacterium]
MLKSMNGSKSVKRSGMFGILAIAALLVIFAAGPAQAAPLGLQISYPDIFTQSINVEYFAEANELRISGWALTFQESADSPQLYLDNYYGAFNISAYIFASGQIDNTKANTLTITGSINSLGYTSGVLLTGNLTAFGFEDPDGTQTSNSYNDIFEFEFAVTGGDLQGIYGPVANVVLDATFPTADRFDGIFDGDFNNFASPGQGVSDTGAGVSPVPEPATLTLMLIGGAGLFAARRRRRAKNS